MNGVTAPARSRSGIRALSAIAWRSILGAAVAFALCGGLELGLILGDFSYPALDTPIVVALPEGRTGDGWLHARDPECLWVLGPGASIPWGTEERVNADGYRGPLIPVERTRDTLRIATLGDSSTFGFGVAFDECYTAQLGQTMAERTGRNVEVLDAGVIGYSVRQGLERWRKLVRDYHPDIVIAAFGAVNEHVACMSLPDDALIRGHALQASEFVQWTRRLRRDLRLTHLAAYVADAFRGGRDEIQQQRRERELAVRPSLANVGALDWPGTRRVSVDDFEADIRTLHDEVVATGARFIALSMPRRIGAERARPVLLEYTRKLADMAERGEIELVDGRAALGRAIRPDVWPRDLLIDDYHPSPLGHAALTQALADALTQPAKR